MTRGRGKAPSQRQLRVNEEVRHALAWILERGDLRDPVLAETPVTVTEVRTSPDLKNAVIFVTPLGGGDPSGVIAALRRAAPFLRHELGRKVELKFIPRLTFQADTSFDTYSRIDALLHRPEVQRDIAAPRAGDPDDEDGADGA